MSRNVKFSYLYRDGSNYKSWGTVVFAHNKRLSEGEIARRIAKCLDQHQTFVAHQIRIPPVFLWNEIAANDDDHCFHEFASVELTDEQPDDLNLRSIEEFIVEMEVASKCGWRVFDLL